VHLPSWGSAGRDVQPGPGHVSVRVTGSPTPGLQPGGLEMKIRRCPAARACVLPAHHRRYGQEDPGKSAVCTDISCALARAEPAVSVGLLSSRLVRGQMGGKPPCRHRAGAHAQFARRRQDHPPRFPMTVDSRNVARRGRVGLNHE
jgi:hypothetical protein